MALCNYPDGSSEQTKYVNVVVRIGPGERAMEAYSTPYLTNDSMAIHIGKNKLARISYILQTVKLKMPISFPIQVGQVVNLSINTALVSGKWLVVGKTQNVSFSDATQDVTFSRKRVA